MNINMLSLYSLLLETFGSDQYASQQIEKQNKTKQKQAKHETNFC